MLVFLDMEASSLDADGWPVEVGLGWLVEGQVEIRSSLICPHLDWSMRAWSPVSADVHGIALAELRQAPPAAEVARWVAETTAGATLASDAPEFDGRWLARLCETAEGLHVPPVQDFDMLVAARFDIDPTRRIYAELDRVVAPHRAGPDAARLARAWAAGMEGMR